MNLKRNHMNMIIESRAKNNITYNIKLYAHIFSIVTTFYICRSTIRGWTSQNLSLTGLGEGRSPPRFGGGSRSSTSAFAVFESSTPETLSFLDTFSFVFSTNSKKESRRV